MMKKTIIWVLSFILLSGCVTKKTGTSTEDDLSGHKLPDYSAYRERINAILRDYGNTEMMLYHQLSRFVVEMEGDNTLVADIYGAESGNFTISCLLDFAEVNSLPVEINADFLVELINSFAKTPLSVAELKEFIKANEKKFRPADYKETVGNEDLISYKVKGSEDTDNMLTLYINEENAGVLEIEGNLLPEGNDIFPLTQAAKEVIDKYQTADWNWRHYNYEYNEIIIDNDTLIDVDIYSKGTADVFLDPYNFEIYVAYGKSAKGDEAGHGFNVELFAKVINALSKEKIDAKAVEAFLKDDSGIYEDFADPEGEYEDALLAKRLDKIAGGMVEYALYDEMGEILVFDNVDYTDTGDFNDRIQ